MGLRAITRRLAIEARYPVVTGTTYGWVMADVLHQGAGAGAQMGASWAVGSLIADQTLRNGPRVVRRLRHRREDRREALSHGPLKFD